VNSLKISNYLLDSTQMNLAFPAIWLYSFVAFCTSEVNQGNDKAINWIGLLV